MKEIRKLVVIQAFLQISFLQYLILLESITILKIDDTLKHFSAILLNFKYVIRSELFFGQYFKIYDINICLTKFQILFSRKRSVY